MDARLEAAAIPERERSAYRKCMRYYLDFCGRYGHSPRSGSSLGPFLAKLASKGQSPGQREQASLAIGVLLTSCGEAEDAQKGDGATLIGEKALRCREEEGPAVTATGRGASWEEELRDLEGVIKMRRYSDKTLDSYRKWVRKFQGFVQIKAPEDLGTGKGVSQKELTFSPVPAVDDGPFGLFETIRELR